MTRLLLYCLYRMQLEKFAPLTELWNVQITKYAYWCFECEVYFNGMIDVIALKS